MRSALLYRRRGGPRPITAVALPDSAFRVLVTGCARSGTRHMAQTLRKIGLRAAHEGDAEDAVVSSYFAVDDYYYHGGKHRKRLSSVPFTHRFHQVRHPLGVIGSIAEFNNASWWHWQEKHSGVSYDETPVVRAARYWIRWNLMIRAQRLDWTYRIESLPVLWPEFMDRLGIDPATPQPVIPQVGKSEHRKVTWDELKSEDVALHDEVYAEACFFGYET